MENPAAAIVRKFGSQAELARALGRNPTTVQSWVTRGYIPPRHHDAILEAAQRAGVPLDRIEFLEVREPEAAGDRRSCA